MLHPHNPEVWFKEFPKLGIWRPSNLPTTCLIPFQEPTRVGSRFEDGVVFSFPLSLFSRITSALDHFYYTPQEQHKVIIVAGLLSVSRSLDRFGTRAF